jgi:glycerol-3-phosphate dehydrogenase (NAD(P)+)
MRIGVIGAGAFGTALAQVAARGGHDVALWARDPAEAGRMADTRENAARLPCVALSRAIRPTADLGEAAASDILLLSVPSQATDEVAARLSPHVAPGTPVVACAKGLARGGGRIQTDILAARLPQARAAALSGPGFAAEIARGLPTAVTVAAGDLALASHLAGALSAEGFRAYASDDVIGVELGGALKNVLAIACGVVAGRRLGESARAALIARGLAEMTRLGVAMGARRETFMGLSGLGDLVLTATSAQSRNLRFGAALGEGRTAREMMAEGRPLAEGAFTADVAARLARAHGLDMPVTFAVAAVIEGTLPVDAAIEGLVSRPLRPENV